MSPPMTDLDPKGLEAVKCAVLEYLWHTGERPHRIMRSGFALWETRIPAMSAAIQAYIASSPAQPVEAEPVGDERMPHSGVKVSAIANMIDAATVSALQARVRELEEALQRQKANIEHWLDTGEAAGPEESKSIYDQICAALASHNPPEMRHNAPSVQQEGGKP